MRALPIPFVGIVMLIRFLKDRLGATAIEYGLLAGLIGLAIVVAMGTMSANMNAKFNKISSTISAAS